MSGAALRKAIVHRLRKHLNLRESECRMMKDGSPPAMHGQVFVSVHEGTKHGFSQIGLWVGNIEVDYHLEERIGTQITVSILGTQFPYDRWGMEVADDITEGLEHFLRKIIGLVAFSYVLINQANEFIPGNSGKFVEPLRFADGGTPTERDGTWWGGSKNQGAAGLSQTLTFVNAVRIQHIDEIE